MKLTRVALPALALASLVPAALANAPVTFDLEVAANGVALQFDVVTTGSLAAIGTPQFIGASVHRVESAIIDTGARRFVVYSQNGTVISQNGQVRIVFGPQVILDNGVISLTNVLASDALGQEIAAAPNSRPVLASKRPSHLSLPPGASSVLSARVVDLDGSIENAQFRIGEQVLAESEGSNIAHTFLPAQTGLYPVELQATDNTGRVSTLDFATLHAYNPNEIGSYADFVTVHLGPNAPGASTGLRADPLRTGIGNGLAYLLGLDPHRPDRSRLPHVSLLGHGDDTALRLQFIRRAAIEDVVWSLQGTPDLAGFAPPEDLTTLETPLEGGIDVHVDARVPLSAISLESAFVAVDVVLAD